MHLVPTVNYSPKLRKIIDRVLQDLNASDLRLPDGSSRKLRWRLTRKGNGSGRFPAITSTDHLWRGDQRGPT